MKILFATDGSEYSERAARFLHMMRLSSGDEIFIVHAISWMPVMTEWEYIYDDLREIKEEIAPQILDEARKIFDDMDVKIMTITEDDYPDRAILSKSKELDPDLIVMGARGLSGFGSRLVGSTTKTVAIKSTKPVLIVKPPGQDVHDELRIVLPTDGSPSADFIITTLLKLPLPESTEVILLNVLPTAYMDIPDQFSMEIDDRMKRIVADIREKEAGLADEILGKAESRLSGKFARIEKLTRSGDPPVEIIEIASRRGADIIAVGSSGMRGITGLIGSVSRYILNHAECSVLIGKAE